MPDTATEFTRPNGKRYRPRKLGLIAHAWEDDHYGAAGVVVIGTLDAGAARTAAEGTARANFGTTQLAEGSPGWFRDGWHYGERVWIQDAEKGRPGVSFQVADL